MSKLSVHISSGKRDGFGDWLAACANGGRPIGIIYSVDEDISGDIAQFSPTTKWVYRYQTDEFNRTPPGFLEGDPVANCLEWMTKTRDSHKRTLMQNWRLNPADWFDPLNEPVPDVPAKAEWFNVWMLTALEIAYQNGFKLAYGSFTTGAPEISVLPYLLPSLRRAKELGAILSLHAYWEDADPRLDFDNALRYRQIKAALPIDAQLPIIISEASSGNGFGTGGTSNGSQWIDSMVKYDSQLILDADVIGACGFQLGGSESNLKAILPAYAAAIIKQPVTVPVPAPIPSPASTLYRSIFYLAPQKLTEAEVKEFDALRDKVKGTASQSADDAVVINTSAKVGSDSLVVVYKRSGWTDNIETWLRARGVRNIEFREFGSTVQPPPAPVPFVISSPIETIPLRVTNPFNAPAAYANHLHEGTDFDAFDDVKHASVPVYAVADGTVVLATDRFASPPALNYGQHVIIEHRVADRVWRSWYCHLNSFNVRVGQVVKRGQHIGVAGLTGTTAVHLHLNIQALGHGLSGYSVADVIDPMSIMEIQKPVPITPPQPLAAPLLIGVHDAAGGDWMQQNNLKGLCVALVQVSDQPVALDFSKFAQAGIKVVVRLGYGYADGTGTLPPPNRLAAFEQAIVKTINANPASGAAAFIYGNEINNPQEWPGFDSDIGKPGADIQPITPESYIASYNRVWAALTRAVAFGPAPLDPYFGPQFAWLPAACPADNRIWWRKILTGISGAGALFLHSKTQANVPTLITSDAKFSDDPLRWQFLHFRAVETALAEVPLRFKHLPVYITEANPQRLDNSTKLGWSKDTGAVWIDHCVKYLHQWNIDQAHQPIAGVAFYRWQDDDWALQNQPAILRAIRSFIEAV